MTTEFGGFDSEEDLVASLQGQDSQLLDTRFEGDKIITTRYFNGQIGEYVADITTVMAGRELKGPGVQTNE